MAEYTALTLLYILLCASRLSFKLSLHSSPGTLFVLCTTILLSTAGLINAAGARLWSSSLQGSCVDSQGSYFQNDLRRYKLWNIYCKYRGSKTKASYGIETWNILDHLPAVEVGL
ncbi:hypothetical protein FKM82_025332 [Ascaphus truei]